MARETVVTYFAIVCVSKKCFFSYFSKMSLLKNRMDTSLTSAGAPPPLPSRRPNTAATSNGLLRSVETHVRILQAPENILISRDKSQPFTSFEFTKPVSAGVGPIASSSSTTSSKFQCTSLHSMTTNKEFFGAVVRPCVANAIGGQSYTFLVCGPPASGRSQTLYGVAGRETGLLEYTARELLALSASSTVGNGSGAPSTAASVTTTFSSFLSMGDSIVDSQSQSEVSVREFPPPLGTMPLPQMNLLTDPTAVAAQPKLKVTYAHSSSFSQFHVYRSLSTADFNGGSKAANNGAAVGGPAGGPSALANATGNNKYAMSVLTFIDVAAFASPMPADLQILMSLVRSLVTGGSDVNFKQTRLTQLLEQSLVGPTTLVGIGTISAKSEFQESASIMMRFLQDLNKINQVLMLMQLQVPKWLTETGAGLDGLARQRASLMQRSYERGVGDFFTIAAGVSSRLANVEGAFDDVLAESEATLREVQEQAHQKITSINREIESVAKENDGLALKAKSQHDENAKQMLELGHWDEKIAALEQHIAQCDYNADHRVVEMKLQVDDLANVSTSRRRERELFDNERLDHVASSKDYDQSTAKYLDDLTFLQRHFQMSCEHEQLSSKKQRLEMDLDLASRTAHNSNETHRLERERRSKVARVTLLEAKVSNIIEKKSSVSRGEPLGTSAAGALDFLDGPPIILKPSPVKRGAGIGGAARPRSVASVTVTSPPPRLGGIVETSLF